MLSCQFHRSGFAAGVFALPFALAMLAAGPAWGQAYEVKAGDYTVRGSTVRSDMLAPVTAQAHDIERSPTRGVLNVTVMKDGKTVPAQIEAVANSLTNRPRPVAMTQTTANGYVSYTGVYDFVHGEVLDFRIRAQPLGATQPLVLEFRDRMWSEGGLPDQR